MFLIKALLMSIFPFYRIDFPVNLIPTSIAYIEYNKGQEIKNTNLNTKEIASIKDFFSKNMNGWRYDLTTYAPRHLLTSPNIKINCLDEGTIVANFRENGDDWIQISKKTAIGSCTDLHKGQR